MKEKILVSACLLGEACRYDGASKPNARVIELTKKYDVIPICPEMLGGLPCPRIPAEQQGVRVVNAVGTDVTEAYRRGAEETVAIAMREQPIFAILKARSPSCGHGFVYDGSFEGRLIPGEGTATAALLKLGLPVFTEEESDALAAWRKDI